MNRRVLTEAEVETIVVRVLDVYRIKIREHLKGIAFSEIDSLTFQPPDITFPPEFFKELLK